MQKERNRSEIKISRGGIEIKYYFLDFKQIIFEMWDVSCSQIATSSGYNKNNKNILFIS